MFDVMCMVIAFGLFLLYDGNQMYWHKRYLQPAFFLGCLLLILPFIITLYHSDFGKVSYLFFSIALLCIGLEVYVLFYALPFQETYGKDGGSRLCKSGAYGLCRHPGFWTLSGCFFSLALAFPTEPLWPLAIGASGINFLYILFQDVISFPRLFADYRSYRKEVPFLIPKWVHRQTSGKSRR